ncbi:hypothetical protein C2G38_2173902 [Gigaspora rosea]|uniref:Uncharacterized protein n=1 Tax=Gigaspora rosea TaxID=44941 RepID=A0A397TT55_9GLOM|nr:hypothetical protein C2G38_2231535 [Gigaspora rosea]RIB22445.1 hypothetical protein C2G38_2173902 [Gigaspora rosea]
MCQFCTELQELDNKYIFTNNYLKDAQNFNVKYKELLQTNTNYNYTKLQNIDSEDKIIHLLSFAYNVKQTIHLNKDKNLLKTNNEIEFPNQKIILLNNIRVKSGLLLFLKKFH